MIKYLTQSELDSFFTQVQGVRDTALFNLVYHLALRVKEVVDLKHEDVILEDGEPLVAVRGAKNGLSRLFPIEKTMYNKLRAYLRDRRAKPGAESSPYLFASSRAPGKPLSTRGIQRLFTRYAEQAEIKPRLNKSGQPELGIHLLRHSSAVHMILAGTDIRTVKTRLRHKRLETTMVYLELADPEERRLQREASQRLKR